MGDLVRSRGPLGLPSRLDAQVGREVRRLEAQSLVHQKAAELALRRQSELTGQAQDEVAFLAMKEAAYAQAFPHAAHRLAWVGDQHALALVETIRRAG